MTENTNETKEVVELAFDKFELYLTAAKKVIDQYGGDVTDLGLMALRIEAASQLITPLIVLLVSSVVVYKLVNKRSIWVTCYSSDTIEKISKKSYEYRNKKEDWLLGKTKGKTINDNGCYEVFGIEERFESIASAVAVIVLSLAVIKSIFHLINLWAFIGIFYPKAYAVHKFILN